MIANKPVVIIGTGLAGYSVAREFRKLDFHSPLIIVTADDGRYYSKPMLSSAFTSRKTPEILAIADVLAMAKQLAADIRVFSKITAIHPDTKTIHIGQEALEYRKLVLAIGADPIRIPVAGNAQDRLMSVNDLLDYTQFREAIAGAKHLVVMGAGLIGCEFANDLHHAGIRVDVVDPTSHPLSRFLPEAVGRAIERELSSRIGVRWRFGQTISLVDSNKHGLSVTFSDNEIAQTDGILSSVGLRPRTQMASEAGIRTNRGIVTDQYLETSAPDVYALGDCAEVEGLVLPFVMPIMHAARALSKTLAGERTLVSYPAMPILVKTTSYPVIVSPPKPGIEGAWEIHKQKGGVLALYYGEDKTLQGFALTGTAVAEKNKLVKELPPVLS